MSDQPKPLAAAAPPRKNDDDQVTTEGWLLAVFIPIFGLIYGLGKLGKGHVGPGLALMITSVVSTAVLALLYTAA